jgi:hypothetical protein
VGLVVKYHSMKMYVGGVAVVTISIRLIFEDPPPPGAHYIGPRAGLGVVAKIKILYLLGVEARIPSLY